MSAESRLSGRKVCWRGDGQMSAPAFVALAKSDELQARAETAFSSLRHCALCPRACGVDRLAGDRGFCRAGPVARVYRHMVHNGEEPPISGHSGSGTIFWSHCTMACVYCQNHRMSQDDEGSDRTSEEVRDMMLRLEDAGCHNINLVSPTQFLPHVLDALSKAHEEGFSLPVVWNTSGYECEETLRLLDGVVDVYLSDIRYASDEYARAFSAAPDYVGVSRAALVEMGRQVGDLVVDDEGVAVRGLIVRHLVLPNGVAGTAESMRFLAEKLGTGTFVSLMAQYYPAYRACEHPALSRRLTRREWHVAREELAASGIENGWIQELPGGLSPIAGTRIPSDE